MTKQIPGLNTGFTGFSSLLVILEAHAGGEPVQVQDLSWRGQAAGAPWRAEGQSAACHRHRHHRCKPLLKDLIERGVLVVPFSTDRNMPDLRFDETNTDDEAAGKMKRQLWQLASI
uniref:Uncharacterized protein n=1 Tax=Oryza punctata TaxID=4537 RepID=A0A0E0MLQ3_ORYPU